MLDMLSSLGSGVILVVLAFFTLRRFTRLRANQCATLAALLGIGGYLVAGPSLSSTSADAIALHVTVYLVTAYILGLLAAHRATAASGGRGRRFHWAPAVIIGFFGVVLVTSAITMVVSRDGLPAMLNAWLPPPAAGGAVQSVFPGVMPRDFQKKESLYNQYLEQVAAQRARGWQVRKGWLAAPVASVPAVFQVALADREGRGLAGAAISGSFLRPSDSRKDQAFAMHEVAPGLYQATLALPEPGAWELLLEVRHGKDLHEVRGRTAVAASREPGA